MILGRYSPGEAETRRALSSNGPPTAARWRLGAMRGRLAAAERARHAATPMAGEGRSGASNMVPIKSSITPIPIYIKYNI